MAVKVIFWYITKGVSAGNPKMNSNHYWNDIQSPTSLLIGAKKCGYRSR